MVDAVQRPRGPMGWSPTYAHLGWPSDTTFKQRERWREQYDAGQREVGQIPLTRNPTQHPGEHGIETRYRVGWRGRLVLQVYVPNPLPWPHGFGYAGFVGWRDATVGDLQALYQDGVQVAPIGHR